MGKKWVNIDIFRNLPNRFTSQPHRRFKSYKLKKKKYFLYIYIEYEILIKFLLGKSGNVYIIKTHVDSFFKKKKIVGLSSKNHLKLLQLLPSESQ
jgi:hypothetical protein